MQGVDPNLRNEFPKDKLYECPECGDATPSGSTSDHLCLACYIEEVSPVVHDRGCFWYRAEAAARHTKIQEECNGRCEIPNEPWAHEMCDGLSQYTKTNYLIRNGYDDGPGPGQKWELFIWDRYHANFKTLREAKAFVDEHMRTH